MVDKSTAGADLPLHWADPELLGSRPSIDFEEYQEDLENSLILYPGDYYYIVHTLDNDHPEPNYYIRFMPRTTVDGSEPMGSFQVTGEWTNGQKISLQEEELERVEFMSGEMEQLAIPARGLPMRWIGCFVERIQVV